MTNKCTHILLSLALFMCSRVCAKDTDTPGVGDYANNFFSGIKDFFEKTWNIAASKEDIRNALGIKDLFVLPGIIGGTSNTELGTRIVLVLLFILGGHMVVSGVSYRMFNITALIFVYGFSLVFSQVVKVLEILKEKNPDSKLLMEVLHYPATKIALSVFLCAGIAALVAVLFRMFFKTAILGAVGWFIMFGKGGEIFRQIQAETGFFLLALAIFFILFFLKTLEKELQACLFKCVFAFFGNILIFFSIGEAFDLNLALPSLVLNYTKEEPMTIASYEFLGLAVLMALSIYIQGMRRAK
ncbi:hypothetical protein NECID01_0340 [Nematocida sp. AWRm77]|nr:hypothetical protein NECID01_0340 [Nematocida sp. AWRm77]